MMNPFKRLRLLREVYAEERQAYEEEQHLLEDARIPSPNPKTIAHIVRERADLQRIVVHIDELLGLIVPHASLDWVSLFFRFGLTIMIFYTFTAPSLWYFREQHVQTKLVNVASGVGTTRNFEYVPINVVIPTEGTSMSYTRMKTTLIHASPGREGEVIGLASSGEKQLTMFWLESFEKKQVLWKQFFYDESIVRMGASSTIWSDVSLSGAAVAFSSSSTRAARGVLVGGIREQKKSRLILQAVDEQGLLSGERISVDAGKHASESVDEVQVFSWGDRWAVLTVTVPPKGSSLLDKRQVIVRIFDENLHLVSDVALNTEALETDVFPSFASVPGNPQQFYIFTSAHPAFESNKTGRGDELYAIRSDEKGVIYEYFQLTKNGRPHDFSPSSLVQAPQGTFLLAWHKVYAAGVDQDFETGYPRYSGRNSMFALNTNLVPFDIIPIFDGSPVLEKDLKRQGVTRTRLLLSGRHVYAFYNLIVEDPGTDTVTNEVYIQSFRLEQDY